MSRVDAGQGHPGGDEHAAAVPELDQWLRAVVQRGDLHPSHIAEAMQADGFGAAQAQVLSALAVLRYEPAPLSDGWRPSRLEDAALSLLRHYRCARQEVLAQTEVPPAAPLSPALVGGAGQRTLADGRAVAVRLTGRSPDLAVLDDVLSPQECAGLIALAREHLSTSRVIAVGGDVVDDDTRSSSDAFLAPGCSPLLTRVEERIAELVGWPVRCMEQMSVVRYLPGQKFEPHWDYFLDLGDGAYRTTMEEGGQRIGTVVLYLNQAREGGPTSFDFAGVTVWPRAGSALYFTYRQADGRPDPTSLHAGVAVQSGEKWIATLWLREQPCRD